MVTLGFFALVCLAALLVAWIVNVVVAPLGGERPGDTGRLWLDIVLRLFAVREFGVIGRFLNYAAPGGWALRVLYGLGAIGILALLIGGCRD